MRYESKDLLLAGAFGWLCGMRSMAGPAIIGDRLLRNSIATTLLKVGAVGEIAADKHPQIPNRNALAPLAARTLAGAVTGAAIVVSGAGWQRRGPLRARGYRHRRSDEETLQAALAGAVIGGITAFTATHVSFRVRRYASANTDVPNIVLGAAEDVVVYGVGVLLADALQAT